MNPKSQKCHSEESPTRKSHQMDSTSSPMNHQQNLNSSEPDSIPNSEIDQDSSDPSLREACGVFGCVISEDVRVPSDLLCQTIMDGLLALQHRGQEGAGIVVSDGKGSKQFRSHRSHGLVPTVFTREVVERLRGGTLGLGHTRYSTVGGEDVANLQPFMVYTRHGPLSLAHNGQLVNADTLRKAVLERGVGLSTSSDSELIAQMLSLTPPRGEHDGTADWCARIRHLMEATPTSYSLALMHEDKIYGVRDPYGNRPLCLGVLSGFDEEDERHNYGNKLGYVLSSESCAFTSIGATFLREVRPGEIVQLSPSGIVTLDIVHRPKTYSKTVSHSKSTEMNPADMSLNGMSLKSQNEMSKSKDQSDIEELPSAFCIFEYVYFARPDSFLEGQQVHSVRFRCGVQLATEAPAATAHIVSCVPDSALAAARGFAFKMELPYEDVLYKSRFVGRTFIQPCGKSRRRNVIRKFSALTENVRGKSIVLVDDSIVRGTTIRPIVKLLRDAGAMEVHIRVASPPIRHPCYMGINIPTREELAAHRHAPEDLAEHFGVDSLIYLSLDGLKSSVGAMATKGYNSGYCTACLSGEYPVKISS